MKQVKLLLAVLLFSSSIIYANDKSWSSDPGFSLKASIYEINNTSVLLQWETPAGIYKNNFDIERRDDQGSWSKIGSANSGKESGNRTLWEFIDISPRNGNNYYCLKYADNSGAFSYSEATRVDYKNSILGRSFQNYPNPFTTTTKIRYEVKSKGKVQVAVFDMNGTMLQVLVNRIDEPGLQEVEWNAARAQPGTYIYKVITQDDVVTQKMIKVGGS